MRAIERRLRDRIRQLEDELKEAEADRQKFRTYWAGNMKWFIEMHGEGKHPTMSWLIEDMAKFWELYS